MLSNEKPSAVFKVGGKKALDTGSIMLDEASSTAQLGVSIEPMDRVLTAVSSLNAATPLGQEGASSEMVLSNAFMMSTSPVGTATKDPSSTANRILENLYNYCTSFATSTVPLGGAVLLGKDLSNSYIPVKVIQFEIILCVPGLKYNTLKWQAIQDWYTTLQRKLSLNPSYFEQEPPKP